MSELALLVNGTVWTGWQEVEVTRSLEAFSGSFSVTGSALVPIRPGQACEVRLDGVTVLTGYVDDGEPSHDRESHEVKITGRDRAADLVDCSPVIPEFKGLRLPEIARRVCKPFGIGIVTPNARDVYGAAFDQVKGQPGETAFEFLDRLCRARNVLAWSDGLGNLTLGWPTVRGVGVELRKGINILSARGRFSWAERFSEIRVVGQQPSGEADADTDPFATRKDPELAAKKRHRPFTLVAESSSDEVALARRAECEVRSRAARSLRVEATVRGWSPREGLPLWPLGRSVPVSDDWLGLIGEPLVIASATHKKGQDGTATTLELVPRAALDRAVVPEKDEDAWS